MATSQEIVTRAFRRLQIVDALEDPAANDSAHALACLNEMLSSWPADGVGVSLVMAGDVTSGAAVITGLFSTANLFAGMTVSGTGIPASAVIKSIDATTLFAGAITLDQNATVTGTDVSLTFAPLPLAAKFEAAVTALLAVRIAPDFGMEPGPTLLRAAKDGWNMLQAAFIQAPDAKFDTTLTHMPSQRRFDFR